MATILVVDDEPSIRDLVGVVLERAGHRVIPCGNAEQALVALDEADLLLVDVVLADTDGRDLTEQIRQRRPELPVVMMSGYPPEEHRALAPPSVYLQKPMAPARIVEAIRFLLMVSGQSC